MMVTSLTHSVSVATVVWLTSGYLEVSYIHISRKWKSDIITVIIWICSSIWSLVLIRLFQLQLMEIQPQMGSYGGMQKAQIISPTFVLELLFKINVCVTPSDVTMTYQFVLILPLRLAIWVSFKASERQLLHKKVIGQFLKQVSRLFTFFSSELEMSRREREFSSYMESKNSCVLDCNIYISGCPVCNISKYRLFMKVEEIAKFDLFLSLYFPNY